MRLIDADERVTVQSYDAMNEEYSHDEMSVADALDFATDEGCPPTIDAIPVEWLKQQYQKCEEIKNKIPITLEPNIHDVAVSLTCTELIGAINIVLNLYAEWKKEQEAQK